MDKKYTIQNSYDILEKRKDIFLKKINDDSLNNSINEIDNQIKQFEDQKEKLKKEKKNDPFKCHITCNDISDILKKYRQCINACKQCCKRLNIDQSEIDDILYMESDTINFCCLIYKELDLFHQKAYEFITLIQLNLEIEKMSKEDFDSSNTTNYEGNQKIYKLGNIMNLTMKEAERKITKIEKQLNEAKELFNKAEDLRFEYQQKREQEYKAKYDDKINRLDNKIYELINTKKNKAKYDDFIHELVNLNEKLINIVYNSPDYLKYTLAGVGILLTVCSAFYLYKAGFAVGGVAALKAGLTGGGMIGVKAATGGCVVGIGSFVRSFFIKTEKDQKLKKLKKFKNKYTKTDQFNNVNEIYDNCISILIDCLELEKKIDNDTLVNNTTIKDSIKDIYQILVEITNQ